MTFCWKLQLLKIFHQQFLVYNDVYFADAKMLLWISNGGFTMEKL